MHRRWRGVGPRLGIGLDGVMKAAIPLSDSSGCARIAESRGFEILMRMQKIVARGEGFVGDPESKGRGERIRGAVPPWPGERCAGMGLLRRWRRRVCWRVMRTGWIVAVSHQAAVWAELTRLGLCGLLRSPCGVSFAFGGARLLVPTWGSCWRRTVRAGDRGSRQLSRMTEDCSPGGRHR